MSDPKSSPESDSQTEPLGQPGPTIYEDLDERLGTAAVAQILRIGQNSVVRAFDAGIIPGYHIPGSRFRRVQRRRLYSFMESIGLSREDAAYGGMGLTVSGGAKFLQISQTALRRLLIAGKIPGSCFVPGSRERRIPGAALIRFMEAMKYPDEMLMEVKDTLRKRGLLAPEKTEEGT